MSSKKDSDPSPKYRGKRVTTNGNQLVANTEALVAEAGVFYPITPSTEMGENYQLSFAKGQLTAFGESLVASEAEGEHAAQGGAIAMSVTGKRTVNLTPGQGRVYGVAARPQAGSETPGPEDGRGRQMRSERQSPSAVAQ